MALGVGMITNEAMYRRTWSSFVDGVISKHQREEGGAADDGGGRVRAGRIELRDVMCLEEVLAKLERAEGGWIDYETPPPAAELVGDGDTETEGGFLSPASNGPLRRDNRQQLQPIPDLPPMFENPRPSFLESMYNNPASGRAIVDGGPPPPPPPQPRIGRCAAPNPGGGSSRSPWARERQQQQSPQGGRLNGGDTGADDTDPSRQGGSLAGARCAKTPPKSGALTLSPAGTVGQAADGSDIVPGFEGRGFDVAGGRSADDRAAVVAASEDESRRLSASLPAGSGEETARGSSSPESLPRAMEALHLDEPTARPAACSLSEPSLQSPRGGVAASFAAGSPPSPEPFPEEDAGLSQLSARLNSVHIGEVGEAGGNSIISDDEGCENRLSGALPDRKATPPEASEMKTSPSCSGGEGGDGVAEGENGSLSCALREEEQQSGEVVGTAAPGASRCESDEESFDDAAPAASDEEDDDMQGEIDGGKGLSDSAALAAGGNSGNTTGEDSAGDAVPPGVESGPRSPRQLDFERKVTAAAATTTTATANCGSGRATSADKSSSAHNASVDSVAASNRPAHAGSIRPENVVASGASPEGSAGSRQEPRGEEADHTRVHENAESPELLRLGSRSPSGVRRDDAHSFGRESWGAEAAAGGLDGGDFGSNDGEMFSLAQSPGGAPSMEGREPESFGSMLTPGVEGYGAAVDGGEGVDSLSFALLGPPDESDGGFGGGGGGGGGGGDGDDDGGGCRDPSSPVGEGSMGDCGGLSPVRSARSECTAGGSDDDGDGPSPLSQRPRPAGPFSDAVRESEEEEEEEEDGDITLTPETSRSSRLSASRYRLAAGDGAGGGVAEDGEGERVRTGASVDEASEGESCGLMPPPPPRQPSLTPQRKEREQRWRHPEISEARRLSSSNPRRGRTPLGDRANTPAGRHGDRSRDEESSSDHGTAGKRGLGGGGGGGGGRGQAADCNESIGSFSESERGGSRLEGSDSGGGDEGGDEENADGSSLVEGTPRRHGFSPGRSFGGFYPPLQVTNIAKKENPQGLTLSTLQRSTLQWMLWREEGCEEGGGTGRRTSTSAAVAAATSFSDDDDGAASGDVKGGVLGHLSTDEASTCVHALVCERAVSDDAAGKKADRSRPAHAGTGLPRGATLIIAQTKEAAWQWSAVLESGVDGLSVLSYVMPLRDRRRISAKQAAAFDVVVTTYDVLKAKEVPRRVETKENASPRSWALPGSKQWRARNTRGSGEEQGRKKLAASSKTDHMVSLLHGVWWDRVVADGAQILANQRSARAVAALGLAGSARWCVVERESMAVVENSSERMRCLASFLRIPAEVAMVDVAEKLFYPCRPGHVAPLHPRRSGDADNSLSLTEGDGDGGRSSPGSCQRERRLPLSRRSSSSVNRAAGGGGGGGGRSKSRAGVKGKGFAEEQEEEEGGGGGGIQARKGHRGDGKRGRRGNGLPVSEKGGRRRSSRVTAVGGGFQENGEGFGDGDAARGVLSRDDVTYAAKTLRLRRARGEGGPVGVEQKR